MLPRITFGIRSGCREKYQMKSMPRGTPPNHPKSTGPENIGPERTDFGSIGMGAVGSPAATTLENNEKFRPRERAENGLCREVGGANGNWGRTFSARREAGGWMRMKESYVEGVAAHNGPESCGVAREGGVEALTGETAGWVLSREMLNVRGADAVEKSGRQHGGHRHGEVHAGPARSETPCTPGHHPHGNREVPGSPGAVAPGRSGKATAVTR